MRGVIGILLIVVGLEVAYLVLAGKLPLQIKPASTTSSTSGKGGGLDSRSLVTYGMPSKHAVGLPIALWGGLAR